jgi:uracil phosphoribosyltransferase
VTAPPIRVVDHPVVAHRLLELRDATTGRERFAALVDELSRWVAYEALRDLRTTGARVDTPVGPAEGRRIDEDVVIVPVMRAGLAMVAGIREVVPDASVAHLGLRRNEETLVAETYLDRLPADLSGRRVVVCDPMLATGGSMVTACGLVAARGATRIWGLCLLASAPGVARMAAECPDVALSAAAVDPVLDGRGYIVPGLGDAGDRLFGDQD